MPSAAAGRWWSWCATSLVGPERADDEPYMYTAVTAERPASAGIALPAAAPAAHHSLETARMLLLKHKGWLSECDEQVRGVMARMADGEEVQPNQAMVVELFQAARLLEAAARSCAALACAFFSGVAEQPSHRPGENQRVHTELRQSVLAAVKLQGTVNGLLTASLLQNQRPPHRRDRPLTADGEYNRPPTRTQRFPLRGCLHFSHRPGGQAGPSARDGPGALPHRSAIM